MQVFVLTAALPCTSLAFPVGVQLMDSHPADARSYVLVDYQPVHTSAATRPRPYVVTAYGRETPGVLLGAVVSRHPSLYAAILAAEAVVAEASEMRATTLEWVRAREQFEQQLHRS